jgi:uncharacterized protein YciI
VRIRSNVCSNAEFLLNGHQFVRRFRGNQNVAMTTYMVEYTYTDATELRDAHRPEHRDYLASLVPTGQMVAYGRFGEDGPAGALLLIEAPNAAEVESLLANDPFMRHGLVGSHRVREWVGTWGAVPR